MNTRRLSNVPLGEFRRFLEKAGCRQEGIKGGHEKWTRKELLRPIILQTHIDPVPEFIVKNTLRNLGLTKEDYFRIILSK